MVEVNPSDQQQDRPQIEKPTPNSLEGTPEGQQVRNATGGHVEAIKAANPNASDGSVKNWEQMTGHERYAYAQQDGQEESFVLVDQKPLGIEVVAARQMAPGVKLESQEQPLVQNLIEQNLAEVDDRPIKSYDYQVKQHGHQVIETGLQYQVGKPPEVTERSLFERIGALPLEQQAFVVGAGIKAYSGEMSHQQFRIGVGLITGLGDGVVGLAEGAESLGTAIIGVAQFSRDVMANDPAAVVTAGKAGESLGKLMVGGIHVFSAADAYLGSVGAAINDGDYTKALRDVSWLGQQINSRWEAMSPEEKTRLATKLTVENLGGLAVGFGTDKLAKSVKITEVLEALGTEVSTMAPGVRDKAGKLISRLAEELLPQPMGVTPDGRVMPIPREPFRRENNILMSKADDLGEGLPARSKEQPESVNSLLAENIELPKLRIWRDEFSIQATIPGFPNSRFRAELPSPGIVHVSDIFTREAPAGFGSKFLAQALKDFDKLPTKELRFTNILEEATETAYFAGDDPASTKLAHTATRALLELGIEPKSYRWEIVRKKLHLVIDTK